MGLRHDGTHILPGSTVEDIARYIAESQGACIQMLTVQDGVRKRLAKLQGMLTHETEGLEILCAELLWRQHPTWHRDSPARVRKVQDEAREQVCQMLAKKRSAGPA